MVVATGQSQAQLSVTFLMKMKCYTEVLATYVVLGWEMIHNQPLEQEAYVKIIQYYSYFHPPCMLCLV